MSSAFLRPYTIVTIDQQNGRSNSFEIHAVNSVRVESSIDDMTDTCEVVVPRNMQVIKDGQKYNWVSANIAEGSSPLIARGDKIKVEWLVYYIEGAQERSVRKTIFEGYVVGLSNDKPVRIKCEDAMWLLKLHKVDNKVWSGSNYTLESMLQEMLKGSGIELSIDNITQNIGEITTNNATVAEVLDQLETDYKYTSYIYQGKLRCGLLRYYPDGRKTVKFSFQKNIASNNLEWIREEDVRIKLVAYSVEEYELTTTTSSGSKRKSKKRLQVEVGDPDGGVRTAYFPNVKTESNLRELANAHLKRIRYEGFQGSFKAFAVPYIRKGDIASLVDNYSPERNGSYLVSGVKYSSGVYGYRQEVTVDYKVDSSVQYI